MFYDDWRHGAISANSAENETFMIPVDKIREVIDSHSVSHYWEADDVKIDSEDDGQVTIYHKDYRQLKKLMN
ncbi:hypothetical protein [Spiroplasma poulsonii]|uniref:hypothetical protein n=1 Tax=Spiroplasma poulsonii TaxID=2138 RepID=UPI001F4D1886|nr:hypothetical protein [Spiroplasma poulsonii]UNF62061.1 hypothetical protein MNU24_00930 [Spiroplasma poulsonii]